MCKYNASGITFFTKSNPRADLYDWKQTGLTRRMKRSTFYKRMVSTTFMERIEERQQLKRVWHRLVSDIILYRGSGLLPGF